MRRAGYDVRVLPEEDLGWEENPPTLIEFIRRDLRWCQGNMQYWRFLSLPGLKFVSRYQLAFAILMFLGSPAWIGLLVLGTLSVALAATPADFIRADAGLALFALVLVMWFAPKIATAIDVLLRPRLRRAFGGSARFLANFVVETVFSILLWPIMWFGHTMFLSGLLFGREIGWIGQMRDDHAVPLGAGAAQSVAAHPVRLRRDRPARRDASGRDPLCAVPRRRAGAGDPARRRHGIAAARRRARAHRHRPAAGGDRAAARTRRAGAARDRDRGAGAAAAAGLTRIRPCSKACGPHAASSARCASIMATARARPPWTGSMAASCSAAISCSTSAPMSATASPRSAGSAPASSRSSRSRRW